MLSGGPNVITWGLERWRKEAEEPEPQGEQREQDAA